VLVLSLAIIAFWPYRSGLDHFFSAPDTLTQIATSRVESVHDIARIFSEPMLSGTTATRAVLWYRPTAILSQSIDYAVWGLNPVGFHTTDLILHVLVVVMVFWFVRFLSGQTFVAWFAALLFALHPVHIENVPAIARRHDALAMVFMFISLFLFVRQGRSGRPLYWTRVLSWLAFAIALGAKEIAAIFPVVLLAYCAVVTWPSGRSAGEFRKWVTAAIRPTVSYFIITFGYVAWRTYVLKGLGGDLHAPAVPFAAIVWGYTGGLLDPHGFIATRTHVGVVIALCLITMAWAFVRWHSRTRQAQAKQLSRSIAFFVVWLLLPLAVLLLTSSFALRRLYVAIIPLSALLSLVIVESYRMTRAGLDEVRARSGRVSMRTALVAGSSGLTLATALFVVSGLLAHSPIVQPYPEWARSAAFSKLFFERMSEVVPEIPTATRVRIEGLPRRFSKPDTRPSVRAEGWLTGHAIESWIRMRYPETAISVRIGERPRMETPPDDLVLDVTRMGSGEVLVEVRSVVR
jgi:hypothetical protein